VSSTDDQMIADYLATLEEAAAILPLDRRAELIEEIATHIAEARAAQGSATATVLERLGRPEDIVQAAAEQGGTGSGASEPGPSPSSGQSGHGQAVPGQAVPGQAAYGPGQSGYGPGLPGYGPSSSWQGSGGYGPNRPDRAALALGWMEVLAIVLLLIGGFLAGIGWVAGVILLWLSPRWRVSDKLLGTLVWPGGLAAIFLVLGGAVLPARVSSCIGAGPNCGSTHPGWQVVALVVILIGLAGPILVTLRLVRQARRWAGGEVPADPAAVRPR
jgi:hypothetical protein